MVFQDCIFFHIGKTIRKGTKAYQEKLTNCGLTVEYELSEIEGSVKAIKSEELSMLEMSQDVFVL